ncbi:hypothetical protein RJ640_020199 [Escallonia rubra]|uniref:SAM-dependent methyltransferase Erg6/SMT-type domain-containing protein n=1 Tax=Escallonia rubra TaxID=112253 RepID=A0AA88R799_9ASTE|nr:hypothetical protein RJ640_020199 [Escallonia rubra]
MHETILDFVDTASATAAGTEEGPPLRGGLGAEGLGEGDGGPGCEGGAGCGEETAELGGWRRPSLEEGDGRAWSLGLGDSRGWGEIWGSRWGGGDRRRGWGNLRGNVRRPEVWEVGKMSKGGAMDLASSIGGKIEKTDVLSAVDKYEKYHVLYGGEVEERKANYTDMVSRTYFVGFFSSPQRLSIRESIKRHEHFLALHLGLKPGDKLNICYWPEQQRVSNIKGKGTSFTIIFSNPEQRSRSGKTCDFVKADFMKIPFPESSFDAVYAIEATCHAPDMVGCYKEIYKVLKPGQRFAAYEWCMTDSFDPDNQEYQKIKADIEIGNGLPDIILTGQCLDALKQAGFDVIWEKDVAVGAHVPWYAHLDKKESQSSFRLSTLGRFITENMVRPWQYTAHSLLRNFLVSDPFFFWQPILLGYKCHISVN